jgi:uncharacterized membrane protein YfcA
MGRYTHRLPPFVSSRVANADECTQYGGIDSYVIVPTALVVLLGALAQRVTGLGFALVASPLLVLLAGPYEGIVLANALAVLVAIVVLATSRRHVETRRAALLVPAGIVGVLPGVLVARALPAGPLQVVIGLVVVAGLASTMTSAKLVLAPNAVTTVTAGVASGFMTATAAVGGPALTVYALATVGQQAAFAATAQISFASQGALSLGLKGVHHLPDPASSLALIAAVAVGLIVGHRLADRIHPVHARHAMIALAFLGALSIVVKGAVTW